jgi:hypothetical protein
LLFGHKIKPPQVDLGDLHKEKKQLSDFLESKLKLKVSENQNMLSFVSENVSPQELQRVVTKFLYHKNLNNTYYASIDGNTVKFNTFKNENRKPKKTKKESAHQTAAQSWGL